MEEQIRKAVEEAKGMPLNLDIKGLIKTSQKSYLESKTTQNIIKEIETSLMDEFEGILSKREMAELTRRLIGYRHVDEYNNLNIGTHTRWIQKYAESEEVRITNGGIMVGSDFTDEGINLKVKLWNGKIIQIRFDECLVYQKLSYGEQLILMVAEHALK